MVKCLLREARVRDGHGQDNWTKKNSAEMTRVSLGVDLIRDQSSTQLMLPGPWYLQKLRKLFISCTYTTP